MIGSNYNLERYIYNYWVYFMGIQLMHRFIYSYGGFATKVWLLQATKDVFSLLFCTIYTAFYFGEFGELTKFAKTRLPRLANLQINTAYTVYRAIQGSKIAK